MQLHHYTRDITQGEGTQRLPSVGVQSCSCLGSDVHWWGHSKHCETMGVLGVPVMSARHFISTERDIGEWWRSQLQEEMIKAGKEKWLAIDRGIILRRFQQSQ